MSPKCLSEMKKKDDEKKSIIRLSKQLAKSYSRNTPTYSRISWNITKCRKHPIPEHNLFSTSARNNQQSEPTECHLLVIPYSGEVRSKMQHHRMDTWLHRRLFIYIHSLSKWVHCLTFHTRRFSGKFIALIEAARLVNTTAQTCDHIAFLIDNKSIVPSLMLPK